MQARSLPVEMQTFVTCWIHTMDIGNKRSFLARAMIGKRTDKLAIFCNSTLFGSAVRTTAMLNTTEESKQSSRKETLAMEKEEPKSRGISWALMMMIVIATMLIAVGLAYLVIRHNFPASR